MQELLEPWIEEGQRLIRVLRAFLEEYERLQYQTDLAERECEQLRELVKELQLKTESSRIERTEIAASLTHFINDVLVQLRPAAGLEPEIPEGSPGFADGVTGTKTGARGTEIRRARSLNA
jgi:hypothetical protein